jgi:maltodextrin utilization protein YvdJ
MRGFKFGGAVLLLILLILAATTVIYIQSDRRQIHRQLDALAQTASVTGTETNVEQLARAAHIGGFFTDDVVVRRSEDNSAFVGGRPAVVGMAVQLASQHRTMKVSIENVEITIADDSNATADMTVVARTSSAEMESVDLREVSSALRKVNGTWLISGAQVRPSRSTAP